MSINTLRKGDDDDDDDDDDNNNNNKLTTNLRCVTVQKNKYLIYSAAEA